MLKLDLRQSAFVCQLRRLRCEAVIYAKRAMADSKVRAHYEKVGKKAGRQPFRVAVSDFFEGKNLLEK